MQNLLIKFNVEKLPFSASAFKNDKKSLEIQAEGDTLTVSVYYDYNEKPLSLTSEIKKSDSVEVILRDFRIELFVNGEIKDEEWPTGERYFNLGDPLDENSIEVLEYTEVEKEQPSVISTFENAEGWYPKNGVFVGDCMPYRKNDEYHVLYLKDRHHHKSKWGMGAHQWEHISTKDFKVWSVHPMAVSISDKNEGSICTGSWIPYNGKEYLYYTIRRANGLPAIVTRSVSEDGYHFSKDTSFSFVISDKYHTASARDPKVVRGEDGLFHMFLTTTLLSENKGCLAHYISKDMERWEEYEAPIYIVPNSDQPECPDYFKYNGKYYLVFSLRGRARYLVSNKPFDGFEVLDDSLIPCAGVPKCAEWKGRLVFTGFKVIDGYAGSMTFKAARANKDGVLIFEEL